MGETSSIPPRFLKFGGLVLGIRHVFHICDMTDKGESSGGGGE